jgi:hypothetical protein
MKDRVMKKIRIAFTILAGSLFILAGCQQEQENDIDFSKPGSDEIVFSSSSTKTRAAMSEPQSVTTTIDLGKEGKELGIVLEETVTKLNGIKSSEVITRGTPSYTENVGTLYKAFNAVVLDKNDAQEFADGPFTYSDGKWTRRFYQDPWKKVGTDPLYFYMRMPVSMTETVAPAAEGEGSDEGEEGEEVTNGVSNLTYGLKNNKPTISFNYSSRPTASDQEDILFAARSLTKEQYETALNNKTYPDVLFHHALTGVKFANYFDNPDNNTKTVITKITIEGLYDSGSCVITPREETDGYVDDPTEDYSSGDGSTVVWSKTTRTGAVMSEEYDAEYAEYNATLLPEAFTGSNTGNNLNDNNATKTFWVIPQAMDDKVKVTVEFNLVYVQDREPKKCKLTLNLGQLLKEKSINWKAGELRTYTLKPNIVDVDITDKMDTDKFIKSDVVIENTGNVDQYVRVYMIGNWVGKRQIDDGKYNDYESILMGYTSDEKDATGAYASNIEVARWNDKDFTYIDMAAGTKKYDKWTSPLAEYDYIPYGEFVGLPEKGTSSAPGREINNWIRHDKFYYYTEPIGPGARVPNSDPLFESYEIGPSPKFYIADNTGVRRLAKDVHFVMDLAVQAIAVPEGSDGNPLPYDEAWAQALGVTVEKLNDL